MLTTDDDGRAYVGTPCTLDGAPAVVVGRALEFGTVATLPTGAYQYAWSTIARVMRAGGSFTS